MSLKQKIINALPGYKNESITVVQNQGVKDIKKYIIDVHYLFASDYDKIYKYFDSGDVYETGRNIWNFLKHSLDYTAETEEDQTVKSPAAILESGQGIDCKHYALFAGGVLDAIKRNEGDNWTWFYRFASDKSKKFVSHVFVVINDNGNEIWLDPCLASYDRKKQYLLIEDIAPMSLRVVSGVEDAVIVPSPQIDVYKPIAFQSFLTLLNMNFLGMKDLMLKDMATTGGSFRSYCLNNGYDYNQVLNFLKA